MKGRSKSSEVIRKIERKWDGNMRSIEKEGREKKGELIKVLIKEEMEDRIENRVRKWRRFKLDGWERKKIKVKKNIGDDVMKREIDGELKREIESVGWWIIEIEEKNIEVM